jgi:hypothetical protein
MHAVSHAIFSPRQTHQDRFWRENSTTVSRPLTRSARTRARAARAARSTVSRRSRRGSRNGRNPCQWLSWVTEGKMGSVSVISSRVVAMVTHSNIDRAICICADAVARGSPARAPRLSISPLGGPSRGTGSGTRHPSAARPSSRANSEAPAVVNGCRLESAPRLVMNDEPLTSPRDRVATQREVAGGKGDHAATRKLEPRGERDVVSVIIGSPAPAAPAAPRAPSPAARPSGRARAPSPPRSRA